ncbi:unnamed protein product [Echinostoma caproni]|uniref:Uncharacterized protein n=1 Tax=Echinostoma caproni TaxID=27848 RepID=A0A3P8HNZ7_9TREM|nr:unnamed protein product [Echinostoma caproni]
MSNVSVGPVPKLPPRLPSTDVEQIIKQAYKDVELLQDEIAALSNSMTSSKLVHTAAPRSALERELSSQVSPTNSVLSCPRNAIHYPRNSPRLAAPPIARDL